VNQAVLLLKIYVRLILAMAFVTSSLSASPSSSYLDRHCAGVAVRAEERDARVAVLVRQLGSANEDERLKAADDLACLGDSAAPALPLMIALFTGGSGEGQLNAIAAVAHLGEVAVPQLIIALSNENVDVRRGACIALGAIGSHARPALPHLARLLEEPGDDVSLAAERAMTRILCGSATAR
jgi:HEAT repeat protein